MKVWQVRFDRLWRCLGAAKVPPLRVAILLSVLLHAALLVEWHLRPPADKKPESKWGDKPGQFTVQLAPLPAAPSPPPSSPAPAAMATPPPVPSQSAPKPALRPAPKPPSQPAQAARAPVIALNKPGLTEAQPAAPAASAASPQNDLSALIEMRRRARSEAQPSAPATASTTPAEEEIARQNRIVAANLGAKTEAFGFDPRNGGGVFQIESFNADYADFKFYGWRQDIGRRAAQVFEVRKESNPDIRIAVVRRMIAIIREHETGRFSWQSMRLGRSLTLSAAPADNAGLEEFLMLEFFVSGQVRR